jgi:hypothetical protein
MRLGGEFAQRHLSPFKGLALSTECGITQTWTSIWPLFKITSARAIAIAHSRLTTLARALARATWAFARTRIAAARGSWRFGFLLSGTVIAPNSDHPFGRLHFGHRWQGSVILGRRVCRRFLAFQGWSR